MMPVMDGFAFLEQVQRDPLWSRIPVIVLTAMALSPREVVALGRACSVILTKGRGDTERVVDAILQSVLPRRRPSGTLEEALTT
jgi:CheY-like chemotaxis protein